MRLDNFEYRGRKRKNPKAKKPITAQAERDRLRAERQWQPIETAPMSRSDAGRDREYVLVVYPGFKDGKLDPFVIMAYQDSIGWDTGSWRLHKTPTHWMPLPSLPESPVSANPEPKP